MNEAIVIGRITQDIELRHTKQQGVPVCSFSVAVDRARKENDGTRKTEFIDVQCWSKTAERCAQYLGKGSKVCVRGEIRTNSYTAKDGSPRRSTYIEANYVEFLDSKRESVPAELMPPELAEAGFGEIREDEIPFDY